MQQYINFPSINILSDEDLFFVWRQEKSLETTWVRLNKTSVLTSLSELSRAVSSLGIS